jgi:predicted kinase
VAEPVVIRSDSIHKQLFGYAPEEPLPASAYTPEAPDAVYRRMLADARRVLAGGWPVIVDATFLDPAWRRRARDVAASAGVPFAGLWLDAAPETLRARVEARTGDASDADAAVVEAQTRADLGVLDWQPINAGGDAAAVTVRARRALEPL